VPVVFFATFPLFQLAAVHKGRKLGVWSRVCPVFKHPGFAATKRHGPGGAIAINFDIDSGG